jgi:hypothetical protein
MEPALEPTLETIDSSSLDHLGDWTMLEVIYKFPEYIEELRKIKTSVLLIYERRLEDTYIDEIIRYLIREMNMRYLYQFSRRLERRIMFPDTCLLLRTSPKIYIQSLRILISEIEHENIGRYCAAHSLLYLNGNEKYKKMPFELFIICRLLYFLSRCILFAATME